MRYEIRHARPQLSANPKTSGLTFLNDSTEYHYLGSNHHSKQGPWARIQVSLQSTSNFFPTFPLNILGPRSCPSVDMTGLCSLRMPWAVSYSAVFPMLPKESSARPTFAQELAFCHLVGVFWSWAFGTQLLASCPSQLTPNLPGPPSRCEFSVPRPLYASRGIWPPLCQAPI